MPSISTHTCINLAWTPGCVDASLVYSSLFRSPPQYGHEGCPYRPLGLHTQEPLNAYTNKSLSDVKPANSWLAPSIIAGPEVTPLTNHTLPITGPGLLNTNDPSMAHMLTTAMAYRCTISQPPGGLLRASNGSTLHMIRTIVKFTDTSNSSEALLKFYLQDIPSPHANKAQSNLQNYTAYRQNYKKTARQFSALRVVALRHVWVSHWRPYRSHAPQPEARKSAPRRWASFYILRQASERVNVDVFTQNKRPCRQHSHTPFFTSRISGNLTCERELSLALMYQTVTSVANNNENLIDAAVCVVVRAPSTKVSRARFPEGNLGSQDIALKVATRLEEHRTQAGTLRTARISSINSTPVFDYFVYLDIPAFHYVVIPVLLLTHVLILQPLAYNGDKRTENLPRRRYWGVNPQPSDYKSATLPLSYGGSATLTYNYHLKIMLPLLLPAFILMGAHASSKVHAIDDGGASQRWQSEPSAFSGSAEWTNGCERGIFRQHATALDILFPCRHRETLQRIVSGSLGKRTVKLRTKFVIEEGGGFDGKLRRRLKSTAETDLYQIQEFPSHTNVSLLRHSRVAGLFPSTQYQTLPNISRTFTEQLSGAIDCHVTVGLGIPRRADDAHNCLDETLRIQEDELVAVQMDGRQRCIFIKMTSMLHCERILRLTAGTSQIRTSTGESINAGIDIEIAGHMHADCPTLLRGAAPAARTWAQTLATGQHTVTSAGKTDPTDTRPSGESNSSVRKSSVQTPIQDGTVDGSEKLVSLPIHTSPGTSIVSQTPPFLSPMGRNILWHARYISLMQMIR
ncbi:hypothetical protein PR048_021760 [Dryococelus australis]|uniref:Uncharacterized protein n=1 Tax=Dryococelus australis TaxID=614101 RepID=A0ABQ9GZ29_9NEOP|nr:hypothetical protein PR048_021760 [Dryococelus australis]